jgi:hypothetical protein
MTLSHSYLCICVHNPKLDSLQIALFHPVDGVGSTSTNADDLADHHLVS